MNIAHVPLALALSALAACRSDTQAPDAAGAVAPAVAARPPPTAAPADTDTAAAAASGPDVVSGAAGESGGPAPAILRGRVAYPGEHYPAMRVCAIAAADPGSGYCLETAQDVPAFELVVPAGEWWLAAWPLEEAAAEPGLLTHASACIARAEAGCDDHALLAIAVGAGEIREGLAVNDWYYDPRAFPPPMPPRGEPAPE
ncbi:hypothetical protein [Arenimonas fontis]|uniref:Uncharacterized protein n=1 Tax=Arenimonas fontis TaxID=2608255 RepID=A0A5B2Z853_9GAMM|nr:hypothetical protein [Arenimonas fontis]KAA2284055.1 hypothetical protein F0415_11220 [Arenimonas fontis]